MDWQQYELEREQRLANARDQAASMPLEEIDVGHWDLMRNDTIWPYFEAPASRSTRLPSQKQHRGAFLVGDQLQADQGG